MREAPERIWAMSEKDERGGREAFGYFRNTAILNPDWHDRNYYHQQVEYVRADLSDALLREAMEALGGVMTACDQGRMMAKTGVGGMTIEANIRGSVYMGVPAWPIEEARATLAKLREHLGETE